MASLAGGLLLESAAPYLGPWQVWPLPVAGAAYAVAAAYVARSRPTAAHLGALLAASVGLAAPALSFGSAQESWLWLPVGALAGIVVPAVGWVCVATLRGDAAERTARRLLFLAWALSVVVAIAQVLVYDPAAWGWCRCVANPFAVTNGPGASETLQPWLTSAHLVTTGLVVAAVGQSFWSRPGRRGRPEILLAAGLVLAAGAWVVEDLALLAGAPTADPAVAAAVGVLAVLAVHVAGLTRLRPSRAHVADLLLAARERSDPARLRELVARAVGDPDVTVYWWDRSTASYVDHLGRTLALADDVPASHVLEVESERRPIARVVAQRPMVRDPGILEPVAEALRLSTENRLLQDELASSLVQVRESRSRIVQASDEARRRLERDLHDGAQQLLISTGAKLNLASTRADAVQDRELVDTLAEASDELGRALTELRSLARGITPTALLHGNLPDALEDLALRCPVPTTLHVEGSTPVTDEVATTLYFVVAESLANVAKHSGAGSARVDVALGEAVRVTVRDDGLGGADPSGAGLRGLADRVDAVGGGLDLTTSSSGTAVVVTVPGIGTGGR